MDARPAVTKETVEKWLNETFIVPLSFRPEISTPQREQRTSDIHDAIHDSLPAGGDRLDLLALCETARVLLVRNSKAAIWPTPSEVIAAFSAEAASKGRTGGDGWPHRNSEYVIESTARWIRKFDDWPGYLTHPKKVADELVTRGYFTADQIARVGFDVRRAAT